MVRGFEEVEHTADWAYRVWGHNLADIMTQAAQGLYYLAGVELVAGERTEQEIVVKGIDPETVLIAWLNELLHLHDSENLGFETMEILKLESNYLVAKLKLAPIKTWIKDIKAATYHNLAITATDSGLEVTIVLDV
jgi:SHS2 domain-containing protein